MEKDKTLIPIGRYCYKFDSLYDGPKLEVGAIPTVSCPYDTYKKIAGVSVPWCSYLNKGGTNNYWKKEDWERLEKHYGDFDKLCEALPLDLLWDSCKECGENYEEDFGIEQDTKEGQKKLKEMDLNWIKKIKNL